MTAEPLQVGIVGAGASAHENHAPALRSHPDCRLIGVTDVDIDRAATLAEREGVKRYNTLAEMAPNVGAVVVATPPEHHRAVTLAALALGLHVLAEKPPAVSVPEAAEMAASSLAARRVLTYVLQHSVRAYEHAPALGGGVDSVRAVWHRPVRHSGSPVLPDLGVHLIHAAWVLMGTPAPEQATCRVTQGGGSATGLVHFAGGRTLALDICSSPVFRREAVFVEARGAGVRLSLPLLTTATPDRPGVLWTEGDEQSFPVSSEGDCLADLYTLFALACAGEGAPLLTASDGVTLQAMLSALEASAGNAGTVVPVVPFAP